MKEKIYLATPHMGGTELNYIQEAFDQNWISPIGPNITAFETVLSNYSGVQYAAALSSGTAAIHLALIMLGVQQDDEVICSTFTFSGSANPILYQKATPVFVECEQDTWNMDPVLLEKAIVDRVNLGNKPKAIILVHLYGMPAKLDEIMAVSRKYEIPVIEDAAEALGSAYRDKKLGSFGEIGIYSFNGNKIITTSGGGAMISNDKKYIDKAIFLSTQARDQAPHYQHSEIGFNYRLSNISAGIGRGQMEVLDERVNRKREIYNFYKNAFEDIEEISFQPEAEGAFANRWLTTIITKSYEQREAIRLDLEKENIESRPLWKPMHLQPVFAASPYYGNRVSDKLFEQGLCLPSGTVMIDADMERVVNIVRKAFV